MGMGTHYSFEPPKPHKRAPVKEVLATIEEDGFYCTDQEMELADKLGVNWRTVEDIEEELYEALRPVVEEAFAEDMHPLPYVLARQKVNDPMFSKGEPWNTLVGTFENTHTHKNNKWHKHYNWLKYEPSQGQIVAMLIWNTLPREAGGAIMVEVTLDDGEDLHVERSVVPPRKDRVIVVDGGNCATCIHPVIEPFQQRVTVLHYWPKNG